MLICLMSLTLVMCYLPRVVPALMCKVRLILALLFKSVQHTCSRKTVCAMMECGQNGPIDLAKSFANKRVKLEAPFLADLFLTKKVQLTIFSQVVIFGMCLHVE